MRLTVVDGLARLISALSPHASKLTYYLHMRAHVLDNSDYGEDDLISDAHPVAISQYYTYSIAMQVASV